MKLWAFTWVMVGCCAAMLGRAQQVGIGEGSLITPHPSALLDLQSFNRGLLVPRLSTQERDQISEPATALLIFNRTTLHFEVNIGTPQLPKWQKLVTLDETAVAPSAWQIGGNQTDTTAPQLGTLSAQPLRFITQGTVRVFISHDNGRVGLGTQSPRAALDIQGTDAIILPSGTTAQRPVTPVPGMLRFNADTQKMEGYTTQGWKPLQ